MRLMFVILAFVIDLIAILSVLDTGLRRRIRMKWVVIITALPFLGAGLWWRRGPGRDRVRGPL